MRVVDKFLMQLEEQLHEKKVEPVFTEKLKEHLAKKGFDPLMGARPMARLIQDTIRRALADELLFGKLAHGGDAGSRLAASCAMCHGTSGHSVGGNETLAGMPKDELVRKFKEFRSGSKPATAMHQISKGYTDSEVEQIAAYFAAQKK
jgi:cytochrome c553